MFDFASKWTPQQKTHRSRCDLNTWHFVAKSSFFRLSWCSHRVHLHFQIASINVLLCIHCFEKLFCTFCSSFCMHRNRRSLKHCWNRKTRLGCNVIWTTFVVMCLTYPRPSCHSNEMVFALHRKTRPWNKLNWNYSVLKWYTCAHWA